MSRRGALTGAALLVTPFVVLSWLAPFAGSQTIGNDYLIFSIQDQIALAWSARHGTFPLYLPGFALGHSSAAATMGQLYHPISWIAPALPGYWRGSALEWNTLLRLLSLGLAQLALYRLARALRVAPVPAWLATFTAVYNLRMLDSFRFGAALEGYVGMLLVAAAAGGVYLAERARWPVAALGVASWLLLVSGHPQWIAYGALGAGFFALSFPWLAGAIDPEAPSPGPERLRRYLTRLSLAGLGGALLAAPCLLTFYFECYRTNGGRIAPGYDWTLQFADAPAGALASLLFPLRADVNGAFGGPPTLLLVAFFPLAALRRHAAGALWATYAWALLAVSFALADATPVHRALVAAVPALGSFRVPGRITMWIPLASFPLLAWLLDARRRAALLVSSAAGIALLLGGWWFGRGALPAGRYAPARILEPLPAGLETAVWLLGVLALVSLATAAAWPRVTRGGLLAAAGAVAAAATLCLHYGTWKAARPVTPTTDEIAADRRSHPRLSLDPGQEMELGRVRAYRAAGLSPRRPLATIEHDAEPVRSEPEALARLARGEGRSLLVDAPVPPRSTSVVSSDDRVALSYNTHNRHVFDVVASRDGYLVLGLPWVDGFESRVDGQQAPVVMANALFPAVFIPGGRHTVEFRFVSRPFLVGLGLALAAVVGWTAWLCPGRRRLAVTVALIATLAVAVKTGDWLYGGASFGAEYQWRAEPTRVGDRR